MSVSHDYLGQRLRALRKAKGVTGRELATMIGYSQSGISKIEKGVLRPTVELVEAICKALKVPGHEKRLLLEKTRLFLDEFNKWSIRTFDSVAESQKIVQVQESRAKLIRGYSMQVVFGLLQTREYMLSVFHALNQWDEVEIARAVTARIRRQEAVRNSDKRFQYILDERALTPAFCSAEVLHKQIAALVASYDNAALDLRILPTTARAKVCPVTSFMMFDESLVTVESLTHELAIWTEPDIKKYEDTFQRLYKASLTPPESREFLRSFVTR
jgi:transcriptional regulator with XRE-family HTH domain